MRMECGITGDSGIRAFERSNLIEGQLDAGHGGFRDVPCERGDQDSNERRSKMKYREIAEGKFISRPNRFIARVEIEGNTETVHVKNTGRCGELLVEGSRVFLSVSDNPQRKTKYDLIAVEKKTERGVVLVNMDSQIPNDVAEEWLRKGELFSENAVIRREVKYGNSRFDFYIEDGKRKAFLEVKGVTLENEGIASFPDAPTERGIKHLKELTGCLKDGYEAYVLFVIQMEGVKYLHPNDLTDKPFGDALRSAKNAGVQILAYDCKITENTMVIRENVEVKL